MEFLRFLESIRTPIGEVFFSVCTFFGSQAVLFVLFSVNYWCVDKKFGYEIGASFFLSALFVQDLKITFRVPRPFVRDITLTPSQLAVKGATGYSFPSGHTQTSASVLIPAAVQYRKKSALSAACVILMLLTAFSRLYLGVHTPEDVIVSFLITAVCSFAVIVISHKVSEGKAAVIFSAVIAAGAVFTVIYAAVLNDRGAIGYKYLADCIKNAGACLGFASGILLERKYVNFEIKKDSVKKCTVKVVSGLSGAVAILNGLKLFYKDILFLDGLRYFLVSFWIVFIYPLIYKKITKK